MNIEEMTAEQIEEVLRERREAEARTIDQDIMAIRGTLADLERKRDALRGVTAIVTVDQPKAERKPQRNTDELVEGVMAVIADSDHGAPFGVIAKRTGYSANEIRRALAVVEGDGRVTRCGERRGTTYHLAKPEAAAA